jgi:MoaA/NifB/PqqE/SkfB family radical SAM enzyme
MKLMDLTRLAKGHARNAIAENIYLNTSWDTTKPVTFYGLVNERCNVKCRYCEYWRKDEYRDEMTIEQWQAALLSIRDFVGSFSINFSGGEPFIKPGFIDLLDFCHREGILAGVTTNGSALTPRNVERVVAAEPFNVNISVDAPSAEVHDYLRGYPGLFDKLSDGIRLLNEEKARRGIKFPIIIKPTINSKNFRLLPDIVRWAEKVGATSVNLQPMDRWTPETYDELWIEEADQADLQLVVDELIRMSREGAPILTPTHVIALIPDHFREKKAPRDIMPCRVGLRDFFIRVDGNVETCIWYPPIGNIKEQTAKEIWYGPRAKEIRSETVGCEKLCLISCLSQKTMGSKVKMAVKLLRRQK